jgi:hypothetical protein
VSPIINNRLIRFEKKWIQQEGFRELHLRKKKDQEMPKKGKEQKVTNKKVAFFL